MNKPPLKEISCGGVIFQKGEPYLYLLVQNRSSYWGFPKGHMEEGETFKETAMREIEEETGLKIDGFLEGFRETSRYYVKGRPKTVTYFLAEALPQQKVKSLYEISALAFLPYEQALLKLLYERDREILKKAEAFLRDKSEE